VLGILASIREHASIAMGITKNLEEARARKMVPFVGMVSGPQDARTLTGGRIAAEDVDLTVRMMSSGQPHRALPLTASLCTAVAAGIPDTLASRARRRGADGPLRVAMPSGVLNVGAEVVRTNGTWTAKRGAFYRTARRLFDGFVYVQ
jgi:2-methylaconitate isomerase